MDEQSYVAGASVPEPRSGVEEKQRAPGNTFQIGRNWFVLFLSSEYVDPSAPEGGYVAVIPTGVLVDEPFIGASVAELISGATVEYPLPKDAVVTIRDSGATVSEISTGVAALERVTGAIELDELP